MRRDRRFGDDPARRSLLMAFDVLGDGHELCRPTGAGWPACCIDAVFRRLARATRPSISRARRGPASRHGFFDGEKPDSDEFEDEEADEAAGDEESLDVDRLMQDLDKRKRGAARAAEPAWRKLERLMRAEAHV